MKNHHRLKTIGIGIVFTFLTACDYIIDVTVVRNDTSHSLYASFNLGQYPTDSIVAKRYQYLNQIVVKPHSNEPIMLMNRNLSKAPDSSRLYLFIFDMDSLKKYSRVQAAKGIFEHSLIRKQIIQLNKVKIPLDTIYIR